MTLAKTKAENEQELALIVLESPTERVAVSKLFPAEPIRTKKAIAYGIYTNRLVRKPRKCCCARTTSVCAYKSNLFTESIPKAVTNPMQSAAMTHPTATRSTFEVWSHGWLPTVSITQWNGSFQNPMGFQMIAAFLYQRYYRHLSLSRRLPKSEV